MKTNQIFLSGFVLLLSACGSGSNPLSKDEAAKEIIKTYHYPKPFLHSIYTADPEHAKRLQSAGLDKKGLVEIQRETVANIGKPLIRFTESARQYLDSTTLPKQLDIQYVKAADTELEGISQVTMTQDGNAAKVTYTLSYKNMSPFAVLVNRDFSKKETRTVNLIKNDNGWHLAE